MTTTLEKQPTTVPDGWSRDEDGTIWMDAIASHSLFRSMVRGEVPSYAINLVCEPGMDFFAWLDKNGILLNVPKEADYVR